MSDHIDAEPRSRFDAQVPTKPAVVIATLLILAWLLFMVYETTNMMPPILPGYPGDSFFPRLALAFSLMCIAVILIKAMFSARGAPLAAGEAPAFDLHWLEFVTVCALVIAYGELLEPVGFEITTLCLMMALLTPRVGAGGHGLARSLGYAFAMALPTTIVMYVCFGLALRIPLPLLFLPRYIQY